MISSTTKISTDAEQFSVVSVDNALRCRRCRIVSLVAMSSFFLLSILLCCADEKVDVAKVSKQLRRVVPMPILSNHLNDLQEEQQPQQQDVAAIRGSMHTLETYEYKAETLQESWKSSWDDFKEDSNLMLLDDSKLQPTGNILPIDIVHGSSGLLHRCLSLVVLRERSNINDENIKHYEVLLLQRQSDLRTCPGAWGFVGEHTDPGELWIENAHRAMKEELMIDSDDDAFTNLLDDNQSILLRTLYPETRRRDLQANGVYAVVITDEQEALIQPDEEVADMKWVSIDELIEIEMCSEETSDLAKFVAHNLKENGFK